jgi:hypothetical protein
MLANGSSKTIILPVRFASCSNCARKNASASVLLSPALSVFWSVRRRFRISNIHGPLIDDNLIGRARRPAPVAVRRRGNPEPRVYPLQITVDAISVPSYRT